MNRRDFLQTAALAGTAAAFLPIVSATAAEAAQGIAWPIGCFNRPWVKGEWNIETALDGIKGAGYKVVGLLTRGAKEPFIGSDATPEYLAALKEKISARGLSVNMGALRTRNETPVADQIKDVRKQLDHAKIMGVEFVLTFGVAKPEDYENYYHVMRDAAPYAQERGLKLVLKPHGGASGASEEILRCVAQVKHPNFKIWFDAGNIIYYTGKDPVEELKAVAEQVTGFCAKDCDKPHGSVMMNFGRGKVDFHAVFAELKRAGFHGPVMVECCTQGDTPDAVTENARFNREFLEKVFASL